MQFELNRVVKWHMKLLINSTSLLTLFFFLFLNQSTFACSMYKVTLEGKTMVGCNQDAWRTTTCIWFENSDDENEYGACFTGSRKVGPNKFVPQSGMNEKGLAFSRLTAYHPKGNLEQTDRKRITNEVQYLSSILHKCESVSEVKKIIEMYDHSIFIDDVFIYVDKYGDYAVVEPNQIIVGNDPTYVLANFCPSLTSNQDARKQTRFKNGEDYLKTHVLETSLKFCRSVSDTMSVCRSRNGDGTLLTSIWDTQNGLVNLYFYHSFDSTVQFNISDELAKGDHIISIPELFPANPEFQRLIDYKTPFNENALRVALACTGGFILLLSILFTISYLRKRKTDNQNFIKLFFAGLNILLFGYLIVLTTNIDIYYFDAPYRHYNSDWISMSSYIPFLLLLIIIPITYYNFRFIKSNGKSLWIKSSLVLNNLVFVALIFGFFYWGLYNVI